MINVLSLFDGISIGKVALDRLGLSSKQYTYYSSEIDKNAIKCSEANHSNQIIRLGDVTKLSYKDGQLISEKGTFDVGAIDLLIGGSPCQSFSSLGLQTGLEGTSKLFYEYLRILEEIRLDNPDVKFLLENVRMKTESKEALDKYLGVEGVFINSDLVSFQKRSRFYWSNTLLTLPTDKKISFQDFKESGDLSKYKLKVNKSTSKMWADGSGNNSIAGGCANVTNADKIYCLTTKQYRCPNSGLVAYDGYCRFLTQTELELAQTVPKGYTAMLSYNQACAVLGNGWTVDVITHLLKTILEIK